MVRPRRIHPLVAALLVAMPLQAPAQTTQGLLRISIWDGPAGTDRNPLSAKVECVNAETGERRAADQVSAGSYVFAAISPGSYVVEVRPGNDYQAREIHGVAIPVAGLVSMELTLEKIGAAPEHSDYRMFEANTASAAIREYGADLDPGRSALVQTIGAVDSPLGATRSDLISPRQLDALPLSGRDVFTLLLTEPGVTSDSGSVRSLGLSAGGQRPSSSNFLLDGMEFNNYLITGPLTFIPPEAVQEYRISTNNFSAEYGMTPGFLANVATRYGGQQWSGEIYSDIQGRRFNSSRYPRGPSHETRIGYHAGGPIHRSLFLSSAFDYLENRTLQTPVQFYLPSASIIASLNSGSVAQMLMSKFSPPPAAPSTVTDSLSVLTESPPVDFSQWLSLNRLDYIYRGGRHHVMARLAASQLSRPDFIWSPYHDFVSGLKQPVASGMAATEDSLGILHAVNDLRIGWTASNIHWDRAHPEIPTLTVQSPSVLLPGSLAEFAFRNRNRNIDLHDTVEWIRGRHIVSLGGGMIDRRIDASLTLARDGMISFQTVLNFASDTPQDLKGVLSRLWNPLQPNFSQSFRNSLWFGFISDTFRATSRVTVNLGIRYESLGAPEALSGDGAVLQLGPGGSLPDGLMKTQFERLSPGTLLYPSDKRDWSARVGSSFELSKSWGMTLRDGYGVFFDRPFDNLWETALTNNLAVTSAIPFSSAPLGTCSGPTAVGGYLSPSCKNALLSGYDGREDNPPYPTAFDPGLRNGYAQNFFVTLDQNISRDWTLSISGLGALGRHLITTDLLNRSYTLPISGTVTAQNDLSRYNPALPPIYYRGSEGSSHYSAATFLIRRRSGRMYFQAAYTLGHSFDNQSDPLSGELLNLTYTANANPAAGPLAAFTTQYDSSGDRGNSDFDQRHNLVQFITWSLPAPPLHGIKRVTEGWVVSELGAFRSGFPFSVLVTGQNNDLVNNRADLVPGVGVKLGTATPFGGGKYILNSAAFTPPASFVGDTARNQFYGPGLYNLDASLSRRFPVSRMHERAMLSIRMDVYNVFNHLNLGQPVNMLGPHFGLSTYGRTLQNAGFPVITPLQETSRRLQFLLRMEF
jgi:hypothetical protein